MPEELLQSVDLDGTPLATVGRDKAHEPPGVLHSAFSLVLMDGEGRVLLQKRRADKSTFGGCWSNSVCSHVRPGESVRDAASRRAQEELGIQAAATPVGQFVYRATDPSSGLVEYEFDRVLIATLENGQTLSPDPLEIDEFNWVAPEIVEAWVDSAEVPTSPWLPLVHAISASYLGSLDHTIRQ